MLVWVPYQEFADALAGIAGVRAEVVDPGDGEPPESAAEVEFYVLPAFPREAALAAMAAMPRLRVVQTLTAGVDRVLPRVPAGVTLCNARGAHDASTAEWVVAGTLAVIRELPFFLAEQAKGSWTPRFTGTLAGRTVLIVGYGSIGAAVERRLAGFGVEIVRVARRPRNGVHGAADLPALLPQADVVILLVPVTRETEGMVDAGFLGAMKNGATLVNAARGSLVSTGALCAELSAGRLRAVLDVTDPEPLPPGHPLWAAPNVLITPHVAATTGHSAAALAELVAAQVRRLARGEPLVNQIGGEY